MLRGGLKAQFHDKFDSADEILYACTRDDDVPQLQQLLHATPAPDINYSHCEFGPPIHFAALCGNGDAIDLLLAAGADAFVRRTEQQETAMGIAAREGHRDIVKRLWTCRPPESHAKGIKSQTCLVIAAMYDVLPLLKTCWTGGTIGRRIRRSRRCGELQGGGISAWLIYS